MASKLFFDGRSTSTPSTLSKVDDTAERPTQPATGNILAIIGTSLGGKPNTPLFFGDPNEAADVLVDGPLRFAVEKAFAPSAETNAPSTVIAIRIGNATPAALTLNDAAGQPSIVLTSAQYGLPANATKIKIETGTLLGRRITTQSGQAYQVGDNIARAPLTVHYAGLAASATIAVSTAAVILAAPAGAIVQTIALTDASTVGHLADRINAVPGFSAAILGGAEFDPTANALDLLAATDCLTTTLPIRADLQACVSYLNSLGETFVTAVRPVGANLPPAPVPFTYLAGGTSPATLMADWAAALNILQTQDVQWVVPLTGDAAVHAATDAHCSYMSTVGRKERRALVGPVSGTSLDVAITLPIALDSDRISVCYPGFYDFNAQGVRTLYDPFYSAVIVAAMFAGSDPGTPMTNKTIKVRGLETSIRNPTDTNRLIDAGLLCLEVTPQGFKVVRSITTWLANNNFNRVEVSVGAATDFVVRFVRDAVDPLRGGEGGPQAIARCNSQTESALRELARPKPEGLGIIVGDANSPAYRNIRTTLVGDVLAPFFECSPVIPINFIPITVAIVPYSGSATA